LDPTSHGAGDRRLEGSHRRMAQDPGGPDVSAARKAPAMAWSGKPPSMA